MGLIVPPLLRNAAVSWHFDMNITPSPPPSSLGATMEIAINLVDVFLQHKPEMEHFFSPFL